MPPSPTHLTLVSSTPGLQERPDDELMLLLRGGQRSAFDVLVRRHQGRLLKLAQKLLFDRSLAVDVAQQTLLEIYRRQATYDGRGMFVAWSTRILVNQCRMAGRSRGVRKRAQTLLEAYPLPLAPLPDETLLAEQRSRAMEQALLQLSEKLRAVIVLRYSGEMAYEDIAIALQLPVGTVKSRLAAAVQALRTHLGGRP